LEVESFERIAGKLIAISQLLDDSAQFPIEIDDGGQRRVAGGFVLQVANDLN
jgi:hypothetical protein